MMIWGSTRGTKQLILPTTECCSFRTSETKNLLETVVKMTACNGVSFMCSFVSPHLFSMCTTWLVSELWWDLGERVIGRSELDTFDTSLGQSYSYAKSTPMLLLMCVLEGNVEGKGQDWCWHRLTGSHELALLPRDSRSEGREEENRGASQHIPPVLPSSTPGLEEIKPCLHFPQCLPVWALDVIHMGSWRCLGMSWWAAARGYGRLHSTATSCHNYLTLSVIVPRGSKAVPEVIITWTLAPGSHSSFPALQPLIPWYASGTGITYTYMWGQACGINTIWKDIHSDLWLVAP